MLRIVTPTPQKGANDNPSIFYRTSEDTQIVIDLMRLRGYVTIEEMRQHLAVVDYYMWQRLTPTIDDTDIIN